MDHLDQPHHRRGVEEVQPDHPLRVVDRLGDGVDVEARGVGGQQRGGRLGPAQLGEHRLLDLEVLGGGLDHQLALRQVGEVGDDLQTVGRRPGLLAGHPALGGEVGQALTEALDGSRGPVRTGVLEVDLVPGHRGDLGDPRAHGAGTDNGDVASRTVRRHAAHPAKPAVTWSGWLRSTPCA